jgi:antirestriction protein ArdC
MIRRGDRERGAGGRPGRTQSGLSGRGEEAGAVEIVLMLWSAAVEQGFTCPVWMTFRQATELDAHVRKGEKGSLVVYANSAALLRPLRNCRPSTHRGQGGSGGPSLGP